ncbi:hypothetical protein Htur_4612 (plasmid) [Haloterrigena turkmenica DSM 5511]|uniref:Uncharacterized protein n=1 Tax=Haloterrigena turkmenica (strain ATCC 51198 / DSM 5511 / JCM 9101 / NCIMB 13204 / VKM B-1734 / 4k) TaxID=543526 RepID=D2S202_HALTV|nr:hypothetical protein [Haloterrigena turkmenica]ADB63399.1 hypothetical protein Htur_4612 [Haloterrigena turkmenica DSM 5511]
MARGNPVHNESEDEQLPHRITVVGRGIPSSFELTVAGDIEMIAGNPVEEATIVSESTAEGAIEVGVQQFRFSERLANIHTVDWNGEEGAETESTPTVHVNYGISKR